MCRGARFFQPRRPIVMMPMHHNASAPRSGARGEANRDSKENNSASNRHQKRSDRPTRRRYQLAGRSNFWVLEGPWRAAFRGKGLQPGVSSEWAQLREAVYEGRGGDRRRHESSRGRSACQSSQCHAFSPSDATKLRDLPHIRLSARSRTRVTRRSTLRRTSERMCRSICVIRSLSATKLYHCPHERRSGAGDRPGRRDRNGSRLRV